MKRHFKRSDMVQLKSGGPLMRVLRYLDANAKNSKRKSNGNMVLCEWLQKTHGWRLGVFRQNRLVKRQSKSLAPS